MLRRNATASPCVLKVELISATSDTPSRSAVCDRTLLTLSDMLLRQFDIFPFNSLYVNDCCLVWIMTDYVVTGMSGRIVVITI